MPIQSAFTLSANEIYQTLGNMIISQQVFADNFGKHQTLVDKARVEGTLYGDRKLYYAVQALEVHDWLGDGEAGSLLSLDRAPDPEVQAIVLDVKKQIRLTTDAYLSKRAWSDEGSFQSFTSIMLGMLNETKRIEEGTTYNVFIGNTIASGAGQTKTVALSGTNDAQVIAEFMANLVVELEDYSKAFNDYGYLRSYADSAIKVIWNSKYVNKVKYIDTPSIFHRDTLVNMFSEDILPAKYFGRAVASTDKGSGKVIDANGAYDKTKGTIRVIAEFKGTLAGVDNVHLFAGEELPNGATIGSGKEIAENKVYVEDGDIICKIVTDLPPVMSGFEVGTSWFNARSLTQNNYVTYMRNTLAYLKAKPFITIKKA